VAEIVAGPIRVGGRCRFHRKTPVAIENRACLAEYDKGRRSLTLTPSTQIPGIIRDLLADVLQMPGYSIRVVAPDVGGGFGGKASVYHEEIVVSVLARCECYEGCSPGVGLGKCWLPTIGDPGRSPE
jgi:carbon-monoxide dehydrogenase large subunit